MIHTFAVDPACLDTWDRFQRFLSGFGPDRGRVLLELPSDYRDHLRAAVATFPDRQRKMAEELFKRAEHGRRFCRRPATRFDPTRDWVRNALDEDKREKLRAIVARDAGPGVVAADEATDDAEPFRVPRTRVLSRTAADLADAVAPLLRLAGGDVHFVDPYLVGGRNDDQRAYLSRDHLDTLAEMLHRGRVTNAVHYHARRHSGFDFAAHEINLRGNLPVDLPFTLWLWPMGALHNRFVLTAYAGVQFGHGLGRSQKVGERVNDDLTLLDADHWQRRVAEFRDARSRGAVPFQVRTPREVRREKVVGPAGLPLNIPLRGRT